MPPLAVFLMLTAAAGDGNRVVVISHRGEHFQHPENTIPAYRSAIESGADFIETDVRTTADGRLVILHDATVDRCTDGRGEVARMTFGEIRRLDAGIKTAARFAGTRVPSFEEVLELARGRAGVYVDAKSVAAEPLIDAIEKAGMADAVVIYGEPRLLEEIHARRPGMKVMPESVSAEVAAGLVETLRPRVIAFSDGDFTDEIIAVAKRAGAGVYVDRLGRADRPAAWQDAVDRGATGIQTDRPRELVEFLRGKGYHK